MELDRDIRTIFAYNLPLKASEKELFQFFSSAGQIGDVRIIVDRNTRKSKGFAYIEYANRVSNPAVSGSCPPLGDCFLPPQWCSTKFPLRKHSHPSLCHLQCGPPGMCERSPSHQIRSW